MDHHAYDSQVREVLFYDTPEFDLYNNHFIYESALSTIRDGLVLITS